MPNSNSTEKYNIILSILLFVIPILAVNASFYFFADINIFFARNEQEKNAIHEAEILGVEADFQNQFSVLFNKFFDTLKSDSEISTLNEKLLIERIEHNAQAIFRNPFPKYSLYVFKIDYQASSSELFFSKGEIKGGKKGLCMAFDCLLNLSKENKDINSINRSKSFAKNLLGHNTKIVSIATELKGMPVNINNNNQFSLFIWDYFLSKNNVTYGSMLFCEELEKHAEYGRLLALRNLKSRGTCIGAFLPIYKEYGKAIMQHPLENSRIFKDWSEKLTIKEEENLDIWLKQALPQRVSLGNYTAFCHLERGASHIAVVLVKAIKDIRWPKWLIFFNLLFSFLMIIVLFCGIVCGYWPKINLTVRFTL